MSQFSGKQYRGAKRVLKELKREEAEARQKKHDALMKDVERLLEVAEPEQVLADLEAAGVNVGPALPGLVKRNRKVRGVQRSNRNAE